MEVIDQAVMATIVAAFMIREGGQVAFTAKEWDDAIEHGGSIYCFRKDETEPINVALLTPVVSE